MTEFERDPENKLQRAVNIILELYHHARDRDDLEDVASLMESIIEFSVKNVDLESVVDILKKVKAVMGDEHAYPAANAFLKRVTDYAGSPGIISTVGLMMDSGQGFDEDVLDEFARHLNKNAAQSFIDVLGELQNIRSRRVVIHMLSILGRNNMEVLFKNLHDRRWYLVRNIVHIIRLIGAKDAAGHLIKGMKHNDIRVKKEIIKTLGEMRSPHAVSVIKECIKSPEREIRLAAVRVIRHIRAADTKQILMQQISLDDFIDKDYEEKKEFVRVLSLWKEEDVTELMINILKKRAFLKRNKNYESMACAAYALGLIGDKKNLPLLKRYAGLGNTFFKEHVQDAIRRLEVFYERDK
ncbi:MAG: HEAT repeat domain-containing protein [Nitrospirae bacterium]|nr:HEAT repeat domain-containing protein [Nitrospirota bacterium]